MHPEVINIGFLTLLYAGTTTIVSFKYFILNDIVTKLKQWSISAGNNFNNVIKFGTSETLCNETVVKLENVKPISAHVPKHLKPLNDEQFGHYLAGLIDGDGHFSSKQQLVIVFHKLDVSLAYYIKERVGFGSVKKVKNKNAYLLIIAAREGLEKVINLINGKIRTENKFNQITNNILSHPNFCGKTISLKLNLDIDLKNHWLAGFSDADASFQIKILNRNPRLCLEPSTGKSKKVEIRLNFQIDQKKDVLLLLIKNFLGGNIGYRNLLDNYTYNSDSYGSARKIIKYFNSYHLLSHKYLDFLRWRKTYVLLQLKNGLTDKDKMRIKNFASKLSINRANTFLGFSNLAVLQSAPSLRSNYSGLNSCFLNKGCRKFSTSLLVIRRTNLSSQPQSSALNPYWITGFGDGESSFTISIIKDSKYKLGWVVKPSYRIGLHQKDSDLLVRIKAFFGVGNIIKDRKTNMVYFVVSPLADLTNVIIPHFLEYPLLTQKRADFLLFKSIIDMINSKEHLESEGLKKIVGIKYSINRGLSTTLLEAFPDAYPVDKPKTLVPLTIDPNWLIGFTDGEGCFNIHITSSKTHVIGVQVKVRFILTQHSRDIDLMKKLVQILGCGGLSQYSGEKPAINLVVSKFADINTKIISLIKKYPLQSSKRLEFWEFFLVVEQMINKAHLTKEGLEKIKEIKVRMNTRRELVFNKYTEEDK